MSSVIAAVRSRPHASAIVSRALRVAGATRKSIRTRSVSMPLACVRRTCQVNIPTRDNLLWGRHVAKRQRAYRHQLRSPASRASPPRLAFMPSA
jgi:hypothetical protein